MTEVEFIGSELRRVYEGGAWHGPSVLEALHGVDAARAGARMGPHTHTIHELTHHIAAWMGEAADRLRGRPPGSPRDGDWPSPVPAISPPQWRDLLDRLASRQFDLLTGVAGFDPARLDALVDPGGERHPDRDLTFRGMLHGMAQHNAYHAGQIMLLRRLQGD